MRLSFMGLPGAGKTTLAKRLSNIFNTMYISSGDLARAHGFAGSKEEAAGELAQNEEEIRRLIRITIGSSDMYLLDGFPRTIDQVKELDIEFDYAILLKTLPDECTARLLARGRADDTLVTIEKRIRTYNKITAPLIDYWASEQKLISIDGNRPVSDVVGEAIIKLSHNGMKEATSYINKVLGSYGNR